MAAGRFRGINETGSEFVVEDGDAGYVMVFRKKMRELQFQDFTRQNADNSHLPHPF